MSILIWRYLSDMRPFRLRHYCLIGCFGFVVLLGFCVLWLGKTESGLRTVLRIAAAASGGQVQIGEVHGQLLGAFEIDTLTWQSSSVRVQVEQAQLHWSPSALLRQTQRTFQIEQLSAHKVSVEKIGTAPDAPPPEQLVLPVAVNVAALKVDEVTYADFAAHELSAVLHSDGTHHEILAINAKTEAVQLSGQGVLNGASPPRVSAAFDIKGQVQAHPLWVALQVSGALTQLRVDVKADAQAKQEMSGHAYVVLAPYADQLITQAAIALKQFNPAAWDARAPTALLDIDAQWLGQAAARIVVNNRQPGALAQQRLPMVSLRATVQHLGSSAADAVRIDAIQMALIGGATLTGMGLWENGALNYDLIARQLDLAQFSDKLRPTRLSGTLRGVLGTETQSLSARLSEGALTATLDASLSPAQIEIAQFTLNNVGTRVEGKAQIKRQGMQTFVAQGEVRQFDLSRFTTLPTSNINGRFNASGQQLPRLRVAAQFDLNDSRYNKQPLSGHGKLDVDWPRIPHMDMALHAGANHFTAQGAFGQAHDRLHVALIAPAIAGGIDAKADLDGGTQQHQLHTRVQLGQRIITLTAQGGMEEKNLTWQGQLSNLQIQDDAQIALLHLDKPAALSMSRDAWTLNEAHLVGDSRAWQATLNAHADPRHVQAALSVQGQQLGRVEAKASAGMRGAWALDEHAPVCGDAQLDMTDLTWLAPLMGEGWKSGGNLNGTLHLNGTPAHPLASGQFHGTELNLYLPEQGLRLNRGVLDLALKENRLRVNTLSFDSVLQAPPRILRKQGGDDIAALTHTPGRLAITGETVLGQDATTSQALLNIHLDRFGIYQQADQWTAISGDSQLTWQDAALKVRGKFAVDAGYWQLAPAGAPSLSEDVVIKGADKSAALRLRPNLDVDVSIDTGKYLYFSGAGLSSRLEGALRLRASGRDLPRASGSISAVDGRFDAYGQTLAIEKGVLSFQGLLDNPALDVRAMRKGLAVEAGVQIGGTAQRPVIKLVSDPNVPDPEKLSWLVLGRATDNASGADAGLLLAAAGGLFGNDSGKLVQQLKNGFGIDNVEIRQGQLGGDSARQMGSRVAAGSSSYGTSDQILSVGKRLSKNAVLSYESALGKAESIVKLTIDLNRQVAVVGRAGSDNAVDVFYTFKSGR